MVGLDDGRIDLLTEAVTLPGASTTGKIPENAISFSPARTDAPSTATFTPAKVPFTQLPPTAPPRHIGLAHVGQADVVSVSLSTSCPLRSTLAAEHSFSGAFAGMPPLRSDLSWLAGCSGRHCSIDLAKLCRKARAALRQIATDDCAGFRATLPGLNRAR